MIQRLLILSACFAVGASGATAPARVDFRRDVQPLIEKHCIACHGPEQQMNAFRLDRRSAAMRGGTRSVIVPGNSAASRLYLRLIGDHFGKRMPATGPLGPEEIAIFKAWIDEGAPWPDDLAHELVLSRPNPEASRLIEVLRAGDRKVSDAIEQHPEILNERGPGGSTPLMFAALYADARTVTAMLEAGADPNKKNDAGATALMWAVDDFEKTKALLAHRANVNAVSTDGRTPLLIAAGLSGNERVVRMLLDNKANPNPKGRSPGDTSPLREAAAAGDAASIEMLIAAGADRHNAGSGAVSGALEAHCIQCVSLLGAMDATAYSSALLTLAVGSDTASIRYVLDRGANVNAADGDGRTALMYAANNDRLPVETVKLLLERGADVNLRNREGYSALDAARLHGDTPIVAMLTKAGARSAQPVTPSPETRGAASISQAVERALPLIQKADLNFTRKSGCVSCHNEALTEMALSTARKSGFAVNEPMAKQEMNGVVAFFSEWRERMLQGMAPGGPAYILLGLHAEQYQADFLTDAIARFIKLRQSKEGSWGVGCGGSRNPLCGDEVTNTANSLRALRLYGPVTHRAEYDGAIRRAAAWLETARTYTHEDRTFRLLGLVWADANRELVKGAAAELLRTQREDGGWADNPYMRSTAYATGEALVALHEAGVSTRDAAWQRGIRFLLQTQQKDGSWYVKSHSYGTQPYFDNGFPHGLDQWISAAATNWATMALALAQPAREARLQ